MNLLRRYYIKEFVKTLLIIVLGVSIIFSVIGLIDKMGEFMAYNPPKVLLLLYILYSLPVYLNYLLPVSTLFSSLFVFSQAVQRLEIVTVKSAGVSIKTFLSPFLIIALILVLIGYLIGDVLSPKSFRKLHSLRNEITNRPKGYTFKDGALYMRGEDGSVIRISLYLPEQKVCKGISVFKMDDEGLKEKIEAPQAIWTDDGWFLQDALLTDLINGVVYKKGEMLLKELDSPDILVGGVWKSEEMILFELWRYKMRLNNAGFKNMKLDVDISSRATYALVNAIMLILGLSLSLSGGRLRGILFKGHRAYTVRQNNLFIAGIGVLISILYWLGYTFCLSLGYAGAVPPFIAPVIVPLMFTLLSVYLFRAIQE